VFGRVSAGKSSLLNWWLGQPLLPTGVTPVTAVPVRIVHADQVRVQVRRASSAPADVAWDQLEAYATERGNPGNSKRILEILIEAPSERLRGGVCLVDTPGLGSLATAGAAQTLEYLPRCDLGILLINAGTPVTAEDVDVARALIEGGSDLLLIASKADQLSKPDLQQTMEYLEAQFRERLAVPVSVRPVSTVVTHANLATEWFEREVAPRLTQHAEQAARALRRKISVLREEVSAVLEARLRSGAEQPERAPTQSPGARATDALRDRIAQVRADREYPRQQLLDLRLRLTAFAGAVLEAATDELARCWLGPPRAGSEIAQGMETAMAQRADEAGRAVAHMLSELRERMADVLQESGCSPEAVQELDRPRGRPVLDLTSLPRSVRYERPAWLPRLSWLAHALAHARIRRTMLAALEAQLAVYGEALCHWGMRYLDELDARFEAAVASRESADRFAAEASLVTGAAAAARQDLELLRGWPVDARQEESSRTSRSEQPA